MTSQLPLLIPSEGLGESGESKAMTLAVPFLPKWATSMQVASRAPKLPPRAALQSQTAIPGPEQESIQGQRACALQGHHPQFPLIWPVNLKHRTLAGQESQAQGMCERM